MISNISKRGNTVTYQLFNTPSDSVRRYPASSMSTRDSFSKWYKEQSEKPSSWCTLSSRLWDECSSMVIVSTQSGEMASPNNFPVMFIQTVDEYGHAKNRWSLVSFLSPHNMQPCSIPNVLILFPVESRFWKASLAIKECRGTACPNQTRCRQGILFLLVLREF